MYAPLVGDRDQGRNHPARRTAVSLCALQPGVHAALDFGILRSRLPGRHHRLGRALPPMQENPRDLAATLQ